jgi:hypothetical protein
MAPSALLRRLWHDRAEIAAQLERYEAIIRQLKIDLVHLHQAIRAIDPNTNFGVPRRLRTHGKMAPVIFDTLRLAERGCTVGELALHVMVDLGIDADNRKLLGEITERVSALLRHYRKRGIVRSFQPGGKYIYWEIVPGQDD